MYIKKSIKINVKLRNDTMHVSFVYKDLTCIPFSLFIDRDVNDIFSMCFRSRTIFSGTREVHLLAFCPCLHPWNTFFCNHILVEELLGWVEGILNPMHYQIYKVHSQVHAAVQSKMLQYIQLEGKPILLLFQPRHHS